MQIQSAHTTPNFTGKAYFIGEFKPAQKLKIDRFLEEINLKQKPYDLFISKEEIVAKKTSDFDNPLAPRAATIINKSKDSLENAIKTTAKFYEDLTSNIK